MKKVLFIIMILCLIPIKAYATDVTITDTQIVGTNEAAVGDVVSIDFLIDVSGIDENSWDSLGMATIMFEVELDSDIITLTKATAKDWETTITGEKGLYSIRSVVLKESKDNKCIDKITYCGDYSINLELLIKETSKSIVDIKIGNALIGLTPMIDGSKKVADNDVVTIKTDSNKQFTINIKQENIETESPQIIIPPDNNSKNNQQKENNKIGELLNLKLEEKHCIIIGIILGILVLLMIFSKINDRKLNKALKNF